jgi:hypothetical protein
MKSEKGNLSLERKQQMRLLDTVYLLYITFGLNDINVIVLSIFEIPYSYSTWIFAGNNNERLNHISHFQLGY